MGGWERVVRRIYTQRVGLLFASHYSDEQNTNITEITFQNVATPPPAFGRKGGFTWWFWERKETERVRFINKMFRVCILNRECWKENPLEDKCCWRIVLRLFRSVGTGIVAERKLFFTLCQWMGTINSYRNSPCISAVFTSPSRPPRRVADSFSSPAAASPLSFTPLVIIYTQKLC